MVDGLACLPGHTATHMRGMLVFRSCFLTAVGTTTRATSAPPDLMCHGQGMAPKATPLIPVALNIRSADASSEGELSLPGLKLANKIASCLGQVQFPKHVKGACLLVCTPGTSLTYTITVHDVPAGAKACAPIVSQAVAS